MKNKKIKFKVVIKVENIATQDIKLDIIFNDPNDFNFAKQRMTRHIMLNMLRSVRSENNELFVRTLGYYDLTNTITILINSRDLSQQFLTELQEMTKMIVTQNINKERPTEVINTVGNGKTIKMQSVKHSKSKISYIADQQSSLDQGAQNELKLSDFPRSEKLFNSTIYNLRSIWKRKNFSDDELWVFMHEFYEFSKDYK